MTAFPRFDLENAPLDAGTTMLEASAGTGKTYTLVGILLRLLLEEQIASLDRALVVTFTIAATEELKTRLRAALLAVRRAVTDGSPDPFFATLAKLPQAGPRAQRALDDFDQVAIATIHGFCKRMLDEGAFASHEPFDVEFTVDQVPLLYRAAADALRAFYAPEPTMAAAVLAEATLDPKMLVGAYQLWQRYPDVRLEPAAPDPARPLTALACSLQATAEHLDPELALGLIDLPWTSQKSPFTGERTVGARQFLDRARRDPRLALGELLACAPANWDLRLNKRGRPAAADPFFASCDSVAADYEEALAHLRATLLLDMHRRLEQEKRRSGLLSFQDLLVRTHEALGDPARQAAMLAAVRERYDVALIDEFQDTDSLQYEIFATCFDQRPLFLIGDPKQSIYGFRGADLRSYLQARRDAALCNTLDTNFRSSPELVAAVGQLFARTDAFVDPGIAMPIVHAHAGTGELALTGDPGAAVRWRHVTVPGGGQTYGKDDAEDRVANDVAAEVARLLRGEVRLDGRPLRPRDFAILTRSNRQAVLVQDRLRAAGIVSAIGKAGDVFKTEELTDLESFLIAVLRPNDLMRARAALATRLWGLDAAAIQAREATLDRDLQLLEDCRQLWLRRGFVVMFEQVLRDLDVSARWLAWRDGERRMTNLRQLVELLHDAEHHGRLSPEGLLEWLQNERRHQEDLDYEFRELRLESDEDAVQILTVHGSKGLQYEIVFCPFPWDARPARNTQVVGTGQAGRELVYAMNKSHPRRSQAETDRLAEDIRLLYVALTRARRRLYVHWGPLGKEWHRSALAWLLHPQRPKSALDSSGAFDAWADAVKKAPQTAAHLAALVAASDGTMQVDEVPAQPTPERLPPPPPCELQPARRAERRLSARVLHSFSSLVAGAPTGEPLRDIADQPIAAATPPPVAAAGIFAFARGAAAGQCLHALLERVDFADPTGERARQLARTTLQQHGLLDPAAHPGPLDPVDDVLGMLRDLGGALAAEFGPTITALGTGPRAVEWQFTLPTPQADLATLAALFRRFGGPVARRYADRLAKLPPQGLRGYLTGFADLVAEHGGRTWLIDWKSNHLGNTRADYGDEALAVAMDEHDYVLQYHLYVLALHRLLRLRRRDYDYERHFGGVCYAFLRGACAGTTSGMFYDRPPRALVEELDRWAAGSAGGRA